MEILRADYQIEYKNLYRLNNRLMLPSVLFALIAAGALAVVTLIVIAIDSAVNGADIYWDISLILFQLAIVGVAAGVIYTALAFLCAWLFSVSAKNNGGCDKKTVIIDKNCLYIITGQAKQVHYYKNLSVLKDTKDFWIVKISQTGFISSLIFLPKSSIGGEHIEYIKERIQAAVHAKFYSPGDKATKEETLQIQKENQEDAAKAAEKPPENESGEDNREEK